MSERQAADPPQPKHRRAPAQSSLCDTRFLESPWSRLTLPDSRQPISRLHRTSASVAECFPKQPSSDKIDAGNSPEPHVDRLFLRRPRARFGQSYGLPWQLRVSRRPSRSTTVPSTEIGHAVQILNSSTRKKRGGAAGARVFFGGSLRIAFFLFASRSANEYGKTDRVGLARLLLFQRLVRFASNKSLPFGRKADRWKYGH